METNQELEVRVQEAAKRIDRQINILQNRLERSTEALQEIKAIGAEIQQIKENNKVSK